MEHCCVLTYAENVKEAKDPLFDAAQVSTQPELNMAPMRVAKKVQSTLSVSFKTRVQSHTAIYKQRGAVYIIRIITC